MRLIILCVSILGILTEAHASAVVSDLALMTRSTSNRPPSNLEQPVGIGETLSKKTRPRTFAIHDDIAKTGQRGDVQEISSSAKGPGDDPLASWRIRGLLGFLIIAMAGALIIAAVHTARVFGILGDPSEDQANLLAAKKHAVSDERDPESLTKLLHSHTMRGYGSMFSTALAGLTSPRRVPAKSSGEPEQIIIR